MTRNNQYRLGYYLPDGSTQKTRYVGMAPVGVADDEQRWTIFRFNHDVTDLSLQDIRKQTGVAWDDRGVLPWT